MLHRRAVLPPFLDVQEEKVAELITAVETGQVSLVERCLRRAQDLHESFGEDNGLACGFAVGAPGQAGAQGNLEIASLPLEARSDSNLKFEEGSNRWISTTPLGSA